VERGSPLAALREACGDGAVTVTGVASLARNPYVQQVTENGATFGWVVATPDQARVVISTPGGDAVATVNGLAQVSTLRSNTQRQIWAAVDGLSADTTYCYTVWNGGTPLTERAGFRTAPPRASAQPVRFLAFGDSGGGGSDQYALRARMDELPYELMIHTGDLAYGTGTLSELDHNFFDVYDELVRSIPIYAAAGNHDYDTLGGAPYREAFAFDGGRTWYSFDRGPLHVAVFDTESDHAPQAEWLEQDLAATTQPWKIVAMHRPLYSSGTHGSDDGLRSLLAPIFVRHGVQLVLAGHDHDYERTTEQDGVTYVVTGGGGVGTRPVGASDFTAFSEDVIHLVYGEVDGDQLSLHTIDASGEQFDFVALAR
jgi:predicted phosphodiesterase